MILIKDRHQAKTTVDDSRAELGKYDTYKGSTHIIGCSSSWMIAGGKYDTYKGSTLSNAKISKSFLAPRGNMILIKDRHMPTTVFSYLLKTVKGKYDTYKGSTHVLNPVKILVKI